MEVGWLSFELENLWQYPTALHASWHISSIKNSITKENILYSSGQVNVNFSTTSMEVSDDSSRGSNPGTFEAFLPRDVYVEIKQSYGSPNAFDIGESVVGFLDGVSITCERGFNDSQSMYLNKFYLNSCGNFKFMLTCPSRWEDMPIPPFIGCDVYKVYSKRTGYEFGINSLESKK